MKYISTSKKEGMATLKLSSLCICSQYYIVLLPFLPHLPHVSGLKNYSPICPCHVHIHLKIIAGKSAIARWGVPSNAGWSSQPAFAFFQSLSSICAGLRIGIRHPHKFVHGKSWSWDEEIQKIPRIHDFPTISWMFNPSALPPNLGFSTQHIWSHPPGAHLQQVYRTWQVVVASAQHQRTTPLAVHHRHLSVLQEAPGCGWSWERLACRVKSTLVTPCMVLYIQKPSKTWILLNLHPLQIRHFWGHPNPPTSPTSASDPPAAPPPPHRTALAPGARRRTRRRTRRRRRSAGAVPEGRAVDVPAATSPATWSWMGGLDITKKAKKLVMGWVWSLDFSYFGWRGWGFRFFETLLGGVMLI